MIEMLGDWQKWDDKDYTDFLEWYYGPKLALAQVIAGAFGDVALIAVFNRIASPSVYLENEYEAWKKKDDREATPEPREEIPSTLFSGLDVKLRDMLTYKHVEEGLVVEMTQFIQGTGWAIINTHLRSLGFKYVGAKDSHTGKGYWIK